MFDKLAQDFRYAIRTFGRNPLFVLTAVLTLAAGIGANTAIFGLINQLIFHPLAYNEPDQLVRIRGGASYPDMQDVRERTQSLQGIAGYRSNFFDLTDSAQAERVKGALVSGDIFSLLRAKPELGRPILPADDQRGAGKVVVLSDGFWRARHSADPQIIGKQVSFSGQNYTVIGVMPAEFSLPAIETQVFVPIRAESPDETEARGAHSMVVLGRLKPNVTLQQGQDDFDSISKGLEKAYPEENTGRKFVMLSLQSYLVKDAKPALLLLQGAVLFVLLIAIMNVSSLLMARAGSRTKEMAIRSALGAGRMRVVRQMLVESLMLAIAGGAIGLVLAIWLSDAIVSLNPATSLALKKPEIDLNVLLFTSVLSIVTGILFGLLPALQISRPNLQKALKNTERSSSSRATNRGRTVLLISELAFALILITGSGLLLRSLYRLQSVDSGFKTDHLLTMNITLPMNRFADIPRRTRFFSQVLENLKSTPGVEQAGAVTALPYGTGSVFHNFVIDGRPAVAAGSEPEIYNRGISSDYLKTMSIPVVRGRSFTEQDQANSPLVAIINESAARLYFNGEDPIGKRVDWARADQPSWMTIVGICGDVRSESLDKAEEAAIYTPFTQETHFWKTWMNFVVRTSADQAAVANGIRDAVSKADRSIPVADLMTMESRIQSSTANRQFNLILIGCFAALSLALAALGIYGVISFVVTQQAHDMGVRVALGAGKLDILRLVVRQAMSYTIPGIVVGLAGAVWLAWFLKNQLYGVGPADPVALLCGSALIAVMALVATILPARRAMRVDPVVVLRYE